MSNEHRSQNDSVREKTTPRKRKVKTEFDAFS